MSDPRRGRGRGSGAPRGSEPEGGPLRGRGAGRAQRGTTPPRGGRGDSFRGGERGGRGGRGDSPRGGERGGRGGGQFRGQRGSIPSRGGPRARGGIYRPTNIPQPEAAITSAEDTLVKETIDRDFDGFAGRRGYGTKGRQIILRTNYFVLRTAYEDKKPESERTFYWYSLAIDQNVTKRGKRALIKGLLRHRLFLGRLAATDYANTIIVTDRLDGDDHVVKITPESPNPPTAGAQTGPLPDFVQRARDRNSREITVTYTNAFNLRDMVDYLRSNSRSAEYALRILIIQLLNIVLCKSPNEMEHVAATGNNQFFPDQAHPAAEIFDLGGGLEAMRGFYASVRPAVNRLLVNLNVTSGAFYSPLPILELLRMVPGSWDQRETFIKRLRVEAKYVKDQQKDPFMTKYKTICGIARDQNGDNSGSPASARNVFFTYEDRSVTPARQHQNSVMDYFRRVHGITLSQPNGLVLNMGTQADPQYVPAEMCRVLPGQPYRKLLGGNQTAAMITFAARYPNLNAESIGGIEGTPGMAQRIFRIESAIAQRDSVHRFGFSVNTQMLTVPGRILNPPSLQYGDNSRSLTPSNGSWNLARQQFLTSGKFNGWATLIINEQTNRGQDRQALWGDTGKLFTKFRDALGSYGIQMGTYRGPSILRTPEWSRANREEINKLLDEKFSSAVKVGVGVLLVVIPASDRWVYARIKYFGDVKYGVHTVCSVGSKLEQERGQEMYMANLALKFNIKGGGINHGIQNVLSRPLDKNTMVVGIDVTHPAPGSMQQAPSVACIVASVDEYLQQWPGSVRRQESRVEMVQEVREMVLERLDAWYRKHKMYPSKIVVYRDGVSEGQYDQVLEHEVPPFQAAFRERYADENSFPKMTVIVVGKRHHSRFYPTREEDADYNRERDRGNWNPKAGTIVDRHISGKLIREFWLQSHQGLQGTARPAHYIVLKDDIKFGADEMEQFTHSLCYLFGRATKAVSICPPAYYADLLCERARCYLYTALQEGADSESTVFDDANEWNRDVHERIRNTTWYI